MSETVTVADLEARWERVLSLTRTAVSKQPKAYQELKALARHVAGQPLDIAEYLPTAGKIAALLNTLDPAGEGSIFHLFNERIAPTSIWHVSLLRLECRDLLSHLQAFDQWRLKIHGLKMIK